jgi:hypothetical protein
MRTVLISDEDAMQVASILNTHAEMQDQRTVENLELMSRLRVEECDDHDAQCLVADLQDQNTTFDGDCDNLRRIAKIFN